MATRSGNQMRNYLPQGKRVITVPASKMDRACVKIERFQPECIGRRVPRAVPVKLRPWWS